MKDKGRIENHEAQLKQVEEKLRRTEEALYQSSRLLRMLRECNQVLVRATQEFLLLHDICRIVVEVGGYRRVWIGYAKQDKEKTVQAVAWAGYEKGFDGTAKITWTDTEEARSPAGIAIRTGAPSTVRHAGVSEIAFPLMSWGTLGVLNICRLQVDDVNTEELQLLTELADTVAYGIAALRIRAERYAGGKSWAMNSQEFPPRWLRCQ